MRSAIDEEMILAITCLRIELDQIKGLISLRGSWWCLWYGENFLIFGRVIVEVQKNSVKGPLNSW